LGAGFNGRQLSQLPEDFSSMLMATGSPCGHIALCSPCICRSSGGNQWLSLYVRSRAWRHAGDGLGPAGHACGYTAWADVELLRAEPPGAAVAGQKIFFRTRGLGRWWASDSRSAPVDHHPLGTDGPPAARDHQPRAHHTGCRLSARQNTGPPSMKLHASPGWRVAWWSTGRPVNFNAGRLTSLSRLSSRRSAARHEPANSTSPSPYCRTWRWCCD